MAITSLHINHFRNLTSVKLDCLPSGLNLLHGDNGSGKTSLLEALYYLSVGRSFRTSSANRLINHQAEKFSIISHVVTDERGIRLGIEREMNGSQRLRMEEKELNSIAEMAYLLPMRVINSQSHYLFESGPAFRRKFLDWGLFYHSPQFLTTWRQFERVLKQRNSILREKRSKKELDAWSEELIKYSLELDELRIAYVDRLKPYLDSLSQSLLGTGPLEVKYASGWNKALTYSDVLANAYADEMRLGYTQFGPHKADLELCYDGVSVKHFLSRGQQKLLICAMILAQGNLLGNHANKGIIYLVDDLPAELDAVSKQKLLTLLAQQKNQVFITAIDANSIKAVVNEASASLKVFHVEHGCILAED